MKILASLFTFLLFVGPVVLAIIGWPVEGEEGNTHLYPAYYLLLVYLILTLLCRKINVHNNKEAIIIVLLVIFTYSTNYVLGRWNSKTILFNSMALPALYFVFVNSLKGNRLKKCVQFIIINMYVINSFVAFYERITTTLLFPVDLIWSDMNFTSIDEEYIFRSSALLGHPLTNALLVSIIMIFILTSKFDTMKKYFLYFIGLVSLFCFNARASIMLTAGTFYLYLLLPLFNRKASLKQKLSSVIIMMVGAAFVIYLLANGYGGRFEERGDFASDSSTLARIEVWNIFSKYDLTFFLWGMPGKDALAIAEQVMGIAHIENWFILSSMVVGLVLTIVVVCLFVPLFIKSLKPYDKYVSLLILIIVVGLSSTNNSLACGVPALAMFFTCSYAFAPVKVQDSINDSQIHRK